MTKATTSLAYTDSKKITLRTSVPKEIADEMGLTDEDSLVWESDRKGKAWVRKA